MKFVGAFHGPFSMFTPAKRLVGKESVEPIVLWGYTSPPLRFSCVLRLKFMAHHGHRPVDPTVVLLDLYGSYIWGVSTGFLGFQRSIPLVSYSLFFMQRTRTYRGTYPK